MSSRKPQLNIRTDQELINRIKSIANRENRTLSNQIEYILLKFAKEYETNNKTEE